MRDKWVRAQIWRGVVACGTGDGLGLLGDQSPNALSPFIPLGSLQTDAPSQELYCHLPEKCANN